MYDGEGDCENDDVDGDDGDDGRVKSVRNHPSYCLE